MVNRAARRRNIKVAQVTVTVVSGMVEAVNQWPEGLRRLFAQCVIQGCVLHVDAKTKDVTMVSKYPPLTIPSALDPRTPDPEGPGIWTPDQGRP